MFVVVPPALLATAVCCDVIFQPRVMKRDAANREHRHVFATVAKKAETNEEVMTFITDKTLEQIFVCKKCIHCIDGAPSPHCIYALLQQLCLG